MKKILVLILVSALGGIFTLGAYKLFLEDKKTVVVNTMEEKPAFLPTSTINNVYKPYETPDFAMAAENTVNAVVHVKNVTISRGQMTWEDLFIGRSRQRAQMGTGSGVIITPDGYIITNNHVVDKSHQLSVTLNNNKTYDAKIVGTDPKTDIALLKIDAEEDLPVVTFGDSDEAKIGEWVLAVGNPFNLTSTVTAGIISAKSRDLSGTNTQSFIQTDAAVNRGNSGGALVNIKGELIGINTAIISETGSYTGYSFAVPSNIAKKVVNDIMEFGNVQNGVLGIYPMELNSHEAEKLDINITKGIYITDVEEGSGAHKAGLKKGDIIKEIDNIEISKYSDLKGILNTKAINDIVQVTYLRNGKRTTTPVSLLKSNTTYFSLIGILKNLDKGDYKKFKISNGVKIERLNGNYADRLREYGMKKGNIIIAINNIKIKSVEDLKLVKNKFQHRHLHIELINNNGEKEHYYFK